MSVLPELSSGTSHIVVLPYNLNIELDAAGQPSPRLSVLSRLAIDAGVVLWQENPETRLIIPGATCYPEGLPDTTDLMIERAQQTADMPDDAFIGLHRLPNGAELNNTHLQAEAVRLYFENASLEQDQQALTVVLRYHQKRAQQAFEVRNINTEYVSAEGVLAMADRMNDFQRYELLFRDLRFSEAALRVLNTVDSKGKFTNWLASRLGARMVDFVEEEVVGGEGDTEPILVVQNMRAAKKFEEVTGIKPNNYAKPER